MAATDRPVTALVTLQFSWGGMFDGKPADGYGVHLVRSTADHGTPGPTLCGIDRFAEDAPGWSVGGGLYGPDVKHEPCAGCVAAARWEFPGLPIHGMARARDAVVAALAGDLAPEAS
jgi:hypothetical protein